MSAGNTGALLIISRLSLNTIEGISKPALAALWPNNKNMNVVLDLGANIDCNEINLLDFASMGSALYKSLFGLGTVVKPQLLRNKTFISKDNVEIIYTDNILHSLRANSSSIIKSIGNIVEAD